MCLKSIATKKSDVRNSVEEVKNFTCSLLSFENKKKKTGYSVFKSPFLKATLGLIPNVGQILVLFRRVDKAV